MPSRDAAIARIAPRGWHTRAGDPIQISTRTEPEPDVALVRGIIDDYANRHPGPNDIALVVEVADTSLLKDRRRRRIYGQAGIGIYWLVNLNSRKIEVYAEPNSDGYASRRRLCAGRACGRHRRRGDDWDSGSRRHPSLSFPSAVPRPVFHQRKPRDGRERTHARISRMTWPWTSVKRRSMPLWRKVSRVWSMPSRCSTVAWRS